MPGSSPTTSGRILLRAEYKGVDTNNQPFTRVHDYYDFKFSVGQNDLQVFHECLNKPAWFQNFFF